MTRRRVVALASSGVIFLILVALAGVFVATTRTDSGRGLIRRVLVSLIEPAMRGRGHLYLGHLSGGFINGITLDSIAIYDADDSLFVSTGPITAYWDPRDLIDKRILLRSMDIQHPVVNLRRHSNWEWNFNRIFKRSGPPGPPSPGRSFGDFVVVRGLALHNATVTMTQPWEPDDSLKGRARELAIEHAIAAPQHIVRRTSEGLKKTWLWRNVQGDAPYVRITDPDSVGRLFDLARLDADEFDPPLPVRNARGPVRVLADSVWFDGKHWDLPASTGAVRGKVWFGSDLPTRYDITIRADSFALNDINWVYETLPRAGGGSGVLTIRNAPRDLHIIDYGLHKLDVRTTSSHLTGAMTFEVGGPVLAIKDVDMLAEPMDFDFIRTLNGKQFPIDWQGQITGKVKARGGPLTHFALDSARFVFRDKHVPGAVSRAVARGELDILDPGFTVFHGLDLDVESLDLRTPRFLFPNFPRLNGTISGHARLDSMWMDVRLSNADLTHHDGDGAVSHFTGRARLTDAPATLVFDVEGTADSLSFTTMARSYPLLPLRGSYAGPLVARGTTDSLDLKTTLSGAAGTFSVDGNFDIEPPAYAARATYTLKDLDVRALLDKSALPATRLNAQITSDVRGDSLGDLAGTASFDLDRSRVDTTHIYDAAAHVQFGDGRMRLDSLRLESNVAMLTASGAIGLAKGAIDSLRYAIDIDSLGALRPWLKAPPTKRGAQQLASPDSGVAPAQRDSTVAALREQMTGTIAVRGVLYGSVADSIRAIGTVDGRDLFDGGDQLHHVVVSYDLDGLPATYHGSARATIDTASLSGVGIARADVQLALPTARTGRVSASASTINGVRALAGWRFTRRDSSTAVALDTLSLAIRDRTWALASPVTGEYDADGVTIETPLVLRSSGNSSIEASGFFHAERPGDAIIRLRRVPLADLGVLAQTVKPLGGVLDSLELHMQGTTLDPTIRFTASVDSAQYGPVRLPRIFAGAFYQKHVMLDTVRLVRRDTTILTATAELPVDLALASVTERELPGPLRARISADAVPLAAFGAIAPQQAIPLRGTLTTGLDITGTWKEPHITGGFAIADGVVTVPPLGITLNRLNADVAMARDTLVIKRLSSFSDSARRNSTRGDSVWVGGRIVLSDLSNPQLDLMLSANTFQAMRLPHLADLELTLRVHVAGTPRALRIDGPAGAADISVDQGSVYLPELAQKQLVDLSNPLFATLIDTSTALNSGPNVDSLLARIRSMDVRLRLGDEVWLRSREANVKLSGAVELTGSGQGLSYGGKLQADRGTYRLDLGLLQRTFDVDSGNVSFYANQNIAPQVNIWATYVVRQLTRQDVHIRAHIYNVGSLSALRLDLSSDERYQLSYSEILSYLLFGAPSFGVGGQGTPAVRQAAAAILPTLGAAVSGALSDQLGGVFDLISITTGNLGEEDAAATQQQSSQAYNVLNGTRIGFSRQLNKRIFYSFNAGVSVCQNLAAQSQQGFQFGSVRFGASFQYRFQQGLWAQLGVEPAAQYCGGDTRPPFQFGFDLFREWSF